MEGLRRKRIPLKQTDWPAFYAYNQAVVDCKALAKAEAELKRLTQDRDLAYTSLIKGIEGMREIQQFNESWSPGVQNQAHAYNKALSDIIEKVVKPLYDKVE